LGDVFVEFFESVFCNSQAKSGFGEIVDGDIADERILVLVLTFNNRFIVDVFGLVAFSIPLAFDGGNNINLT